MKWREIISQARLELDDTEPDYLWNDSELLMYAAQAEQEACRRSRLIIDSSTAEICNITLIPNQALYPLHDRVIGVRAAYRDGYSRPLCGATTGEMDTYRSSWTTTTGDPSTIITDYETGAIRVWPIPQTAGTLRLRVVRLPLISNINPDAEPEIKPQYHLNLVHWIKHRAYLKKDADTLDKAASMDALQLFIAEFGEARPAYSTEFDLTHLPVDGLDGTF
ncbi:hypothetical protein ED236_00485 [Pseudomethylobacillus aquaticus]|uniref:Uncharacterized protein n=1 Tax=Pseudomethylobacillus aquaticus TaxID=2676064 RepID=A0A3N0V5Q6_9PROT|nr:hypothetical protein [Pseudomethylobacillus aquaticus]ROH88005.1 hypothetical protein ED236_00485 [Pseudomethylobacillus aquaticus]